MRLLDRFMRLLNEPTPPFGAISEGSDQQTGAAEASPPRAIEIHRIAQFGSVVRVAPNTASPSTMPPVSTVLRTRDSSWPRAIRRSMSQPPINRSLIVATVQG